MDLTKVSPDRRAVLEKIALYESERRFDEDVEEDPPAPPLLPDRVDYLTKKFSNKVIRLFANAAGNRFFKKLIRKGIVVTEAVEGREYLSVLKDGAVITCNHFAACDNYVIFDAIRKDLPKKRLYKVIREGNFTSYPGLYGFLFRHCDTLPLSSHPRTMMNFLSAVNTLLARGESVLIYPEQGMWWNYRKPRPPKIGGFKLAARAGVPVLPMFITMRDSERTGEDGYPIQLHTLHILPPIYPDKTKKEKAAAEEMREKNYALWKEVYEKTYGMPLDYGPGDEVPDLAALQKQGDEVGAEVGAVGTEDEAKETNR